MSLPMRVERQTQVAQDGPEQVVRTVVPVDLRDITRRPAQSPVASVVVRTEARPAAAAGGSDLAFDLLNKVAGALPAMMERCERLEAELAKTKTSDKTELEAANETAREWQQIAGALKLQVEGLETGMKAMKQRADAAEQQASSYRDAADQSQQAAAEAECLASLFQEKVISSFGAGSALHTMLDNFRATSPVAQAS